MLWMRVATGLVLAPLFVLGLFGLPPAGFSVFIGVFLLLSAWEWGGLCGFSTTGKVIWTAALAAIAASIFLLEGALPDLRLLLSGAGSVLWMLAAVLIFRFPRGRAVWARMSVRTAVGVVTMIPAWSALTLLQARTGGPWLVLWTMVMVWGADIGAYFAGHAYGRFKLMPDVSPGKTLEGAAGGLMLALIVSVLLAALGAFGVAGVTVVLLVTALVVVASVFGDLLESLVKRVAGVKDSGSLLPGHGGVLDRVDGVLAAAPVSAVALTLLDIVPGGWMGRVLS